MKQTNKQRKLELLKGNIMLRATDSDFFKMVVELDNLGLAIKLDKDGVLDYFLDNITRINFGGKFSQPVYSLLETYEDVFENWKDAISVQQLIDELMKVENKDLPVSFFNDGNDYVVEGERAFITCVDEIGDVVDLNGQTD